MAEAHKVFISHSGRDKHIVELATTALRRAGVPIWTDSAIRLGEDFIDATERGMRDSDVFVLIVSPDFLTSELCMYELGFALKAQRDEAAVVIPVAIGEIDVRVLPSYLRKFQVIDGRGLQADQIAGKVLDRLNEPQAPTPRQHAAA